MNLRDALGADETRAFLRDVVRDEMGAEVDARVTEALMEHGLGTGAGRRAAAEVLEAAERDRPRRLSRRGREVLESMIGSAPTDVDDEPESTPTEEPAGEIVEVPAWEALMARRGVREAAIEGLRRPGRFGAPRDPERAA